MNIADGIAGISAVSGAIHGEKYVLGGLPHDDGSNGTFRSDDGGTADAADTLSSPVVGLTPRLLAARHSRVAGNYSVCLFLDQPRGGVDVRTLESSFRLGSMLRHPGIAQTIDFNVSGQEPTFVVLEEVHGESWLSLKQLMLRDGMLALPVAIDVLGQIGEALSTAHTLETSLGDLHPGVIRVQELADGRRMVKVLGFGWGRALRISSQPPGQATAYLAPEQQRPVGGDIAAISGESPAEGGAAGDQFSLAAIAYEMLAGCPPFADEAAETAESTPVSQRSPAPLGEVVVGLPPALDEPLRRALSPVPGARFARIYDFVQAMRLAAMTSTTMTTDPTKTAIGPLTTPGTTEVALTATATPTPTATALASTFADAAGGLTDVGAKDHLELREDRRRAVPPPIPVSATTASPVPPMTQIVSPAAVSFALRLTSVSSHWSSLRVPNQVPTRTKAIVAIAAMFVIVGAVALMAGGRQPPRSLPPRLPPPSAVAAPSSEPIRRDDIRLRGSNVERGSARSGEQRAPSLVSENGNAANEARSKTGGKPFAGRTAAVLIGRDRAREHSSGNRLKRGARQRHPKRLAESTTRAAPSGDKRRSSNRTNNLAPF